MIGIFCVKLIEGDIMILIKRFIFINLLFVFTSILYEIHCTDYEREEAFKEKIKIIVRDSYVDRTDIPLFSVPQLIEINSKLAEGMEVDKRYTEFYTFVGATVFSAIVGLIYYNDVPSMIIPETIRTYTEMKEPIKIGWPANYFSESFSVTTAVQICTTLMLAYSVICCCPTCCPPMKYVSGKGKKYDYLLNKKKKSYDLIESEIKRRILKK